MSEQPETQERKSYGQYQNEIYTKGMMQGITPFVTTDPNKIEAQAREQLSSKAYAYVAGGAGERATMDANRLSFRTWKLVPRMLREVTPRNLCVNLFDTEYACPVLCAPVGVQSLFHEDGELGVAEVASQIGVPYVASTASSHPLEDIAAANGNGRRWFQLYWPQSQAITASLLDRASKNGYNVLVVTLDTWALAWRPWDLDLAHVPFFKGTGCATAFSDPGFREYFKKESGGKEVEDDILGASRAWISNAFSGKAHTWDELQFLRDRWKGPILLKGIQHPDDAVKLVFEPTASNLPTERLTNFKRAHECGMDGVVVSNHGGRQLDGAVGSLDMLPEVADAVRGKKSRLGYEFTVLFDSGVRTGVDVIKALCLGAKAVLVGRVFVYGLGINGKHGARDALQGLLADMDQSMGIAGMKDINDCTPDRLKRVHQVGEAASSN